jgi:hypothetical protein
MSKSKRFGSYKVFKAGKKAQKKFGINLWSKKTK